MSLETESLRREIWRLEKELAQLSIDTRKIAESAAKEAVVEFKLALQRGLVFKAADLNAENDKVFKAREWKAGPFNNTEVDRRSALAKALTTVAALLEKLP